MNRCRAGAARAAVHRSSWEELNPPIPTYGEHLPDGSGIELVRDASDLTKTKLLLRAGERVTIEHEICTDTCRFVPADLNSALLRQLHLPVKDLPYGTTSALVGQIASTLMQASELGADIAFLVAVFAIASFFSDCLLTPLCLCLIGCANAEARSLLRVLSWFCRHPVLLVDHAGIDQLPENLTATRFLYAPKPSAKLRKLVANLQAFDFGVIRKGSLRENRGAVVIYSGSTGVGCGFEDASLRVPVVSARRLLRPGDEECYRDIADEIRAKLLNYRLMHYDNVKRSEFDVTGLTGPIRELALGLGACLIDASELQDRLIALLRVPDESVRMERSAEMAPVLESLLVFCHERKTAVHVGEIAKTGNDILSARGEWTKLSPKEVGHKLGLLGLQTARLDADGRGLKLTRAVCARIHQLAKDYGVPAALEKGLPGCPDCKQFFDQQSNSARGARDAHRARKKSGRKINEAHPA
jgi:hypothetical protein